MNFAELHDRFGLRATIIGYKEMAEEREKVLNDRQSMVEVNLLTDALMRDAVEVRMDREGIVPTVVMYRVVRNLMQKYNCSAFTIECFELCSSKLSHDWKFVPCLIHSLQKDQGYTSGCEGDVNATMAMNMLMGVAKRAAFMGNFFPKDKTTMYFGHNVPARKMLGFDEPDLAYTLQNFIRKGWGAKVQMDLASLPEKTMTIARCDPLIRKILLVRGEISGCEGHNEVGCSLKAIIPVPSTKDLVEKARDYGFHFAGVYGDYTREMMQLAEMLKLKVETYNV
jgi:L-arabinose isomerase